MEEFDAGSLIIILLFSIVFLIITRPIAKWYSGNNEIIKLLKEIRDNKDRGSPEDKDDDKPKEEIKMKNPWNIFGS